MKTCVITGASSGLGLDMAKTFHQKGYNVIALDIKNCPIKEIDFIKTDLSNPLQIQSAFKMVGEKYGSIHILINNGAISYFEKHILDVDIDECHKIIDTNLKSAYICAKEFIKLNKGESYGRIINISSTRFYQNEANWELYGMSKGGIISLTNSLCVSLIGTPITVNAISPGYICTQNYESLDKQEHSIHPSNRVGKPRDITNTCLFLIDEENDFINGANIIVDGGMTKKMIY